MPVRIGGGCDAQLQQIYVCIERSTGGLRLSLRLQLSHESASVRAAAVLCCSSSLRESRDAAVALAIAMLRDSHVVVRRAAMAAVEGNGGQRHCGALFSHAVSRFASRG
jgi:hypothetical protein